jgi:DNA-binding NarL/FixJ family response regulator
VNIKPKILIADDHEIVRDGIRNLIQASRPEWEICGEARDGEQALEMTIAFRPAVVVLDITMPKLSGLQAASRIAQTSPESRILMFTMHESDRMIEEARKAGAHGVVLKSQATRDLIKALDLLMSGDTFFPGEIAQPEEPKPPKTPKGKWYERSLAWHLYRAHGLATIRSVGAA